MTTKREKLSQEAIDTFVRAHAGWSLQEGALTKTFAFSDYGASMGFAVRVGLAAEKRDHHPELHVSWGKVAVSWSTHDAGGITSLDATMAELCDTFHGG